MHFYAENDYTGRINNVGIFVRKMSLQEALFVIK